MVFDYKDMRKRILESKVGRKLLLYFKKLDEKEKNEKEIEEDVIYEFFNEKLETIVEVLPEIWEDLRERIKEEVEFNVLNSPKDFEDSIRGSSGFGSYIYIDFDLDSYLNDLIEKICGVENADLPKM
jgi:hypothetical protein